MDDAARGTTGRAGVTREYMWYPRRRKRRAIKCKSIFTITRKTARLLRSTCISGSVAWLSIIIF